MRVDVITDGPELKDHDRCGRKMTRKVVFGEVQAEILVPMMFVHGPAQGSGVGDLGPLVDQEIYYNVLCLFFCTASLGHRSARISPVS